MANTHLLCVFKKNYLLLFLEFLKCMVKGNNLKCFFTVSLSYKI